VPQSAQTVQNLVNDPVVAGQVVAVRGSVIDVRFAQGQLPDLNDALDIDGPQGRLVAEVQAHLDERTIRAVSMQSTDGLSRGVKARATGGPITVPVGDAMLGRLLNVLGATCDGGPPAPSDTLRWHHPVLHVA
jgi:F-type H+-transporting ATPase subunit beta